MQEARDEVYCHLIARRSVARAALHLGLGTMSQESLDVLASILLEYISRIGKVLAYSVEASYRSSTHVNILDTIRAIEFCTTPAVQRTHLIMDHMQQQQQQQQQQHHQSSSTTSTTAIITDSSSNMSGMQQQHQDGFDMDGSYLLRDGVHGGGDNNNFDGTTMMRTRGAGAGVGSSSSSSSVLLDPHEQLTWRGLAIFLFGPNWLHIPTTTATTTTTIDTISSTTTTAIMTSTLQTGMGTSAEGNSSSSDAAAFLDATATSSGKVAPSVALTNGGGNGTMAESISGMDIDGVGSGSAIVDTSTSSIPRGGWDAPYPGEIPLFPVSSSSVSNPHPFTGNPSIYESLHTVVGAASNPDAAASSTIQLVTPTSDTQQQQSSRDGMFVNHGEDDGHNNTFYHESIMAQIPDHVFTDETSWGRFLPNRLNKDNSTNETNNNSGSNHPTEETTIIAKGRSSSMDTVPMDESTIHEDDKKASVEQDQSKKRKLNNSDGTAENSSEPSKKRPRSLSLGGDGGTSGEAVDDNNNNNHDETDDLQNISSSLVDLPIFYPPLPRRGHAVRRAILDTTDEPAAIMAAAAAAVSRNGIASDSSTLQLENKSSTGQKVMMRMEPTLNKPVRAALVQLGKHHYWGSGWDQRDGVDEPFIVNNTSSTTTRFDIPVGYTTGKSTNNAGDGNRGGNSSAGGGSGDSTQPPVLKPQIVPLGRASGSRVSRILEGSMDLASVL